MVLDPIRPTSSNLSKQVNRVAAQPALTIDHVGEHSRVGVSDLGASNAAIPTPFTDGPVKGAHVGRVDVVALGQLLLGVERHAAIWEDDRCASQWSAVSDAQQVGRLSLLSVVVQRRLSTATDAAAKAHQAFHQTTGHTGVQTARPCFIGRHVAVVAHLHLVLEQFAGRAGQRLGTARFEHAFTEVPGEP